MRSQLIVITFITEQSTDMGLTGESHAARRTVLRDGVLNFIPKLGPTGGHFKVRD